MDVGRAMMRVALNVAALRSPITGVGRYINRLQVGLAEPHSGVLPAFFWGDGWSDLASDLSEVKPSRTPQNARWRRRLASVLPRAHELNRFRQQRIFDSCNGKTQLYHEPNFLPFSFSGTTVVTVHDLSVLRYPEMHPRGRVRLFERYFEKGLRNAAHVITDSTAVRQEVMEAFGLSPQQITAVPLGADAAFCPSAREAVDVLQHYQLQVGRYWMALGTLEPRKNLNLVLEAFRVLPEADRKAGGPLVVVGMQGWKESSLLARMQPFIQAGELRLLGYVPDADLPALVSGARALLYPSRYEGFGLPPLEAMACGTPVIASTAQSIAEVVADAGLLINADDADAYAQAMQRVLHDTAFAQDLILRGLQRSKLFSWERCLRETIAVYKAVLQ